MANKHPEALNKSLKMKGRVKPEGHGAKVARAQRGVPRSEAVKQRARDAYAKGTRVVSPKCGRGIRSQVQTPFQGVKTVRSTSERKRAEALNASGVVWFYEAVRYRLNDGRTYLPDFWVFPTLAPSQVPPNPNNQDVLRLMESYPCVVEDVKGWYGPKASGYDKVEAFKQEYPNVNFKVVIT